MVLARPTVSGPRSIQPRWLTVTAWTAMFGFGIVMALLGAILPLISQCARFDLAQAGNLFLAMNGAMLAVTLALGPLVDRFGLRAPLMVAPLFVAAALGLIGRADALPAVFVAIVLLGIGGGALNQVSNTLIADLHEDAARKSAALNLLGVFFGIGALFTPFTMGALLRTLGLNGILGIALALSLVPGALSIVLAFPRGRQHEGVAPQVVLRLAREPLVITLSCLLFFESGNEFLLGGYLTSWLTRVLHSSVTLASWLLAIYWASLMAARIALSRILRRGSAAAWIGGSAVGVAAGVGLLLAARSIAAAAIATAVIGCSIAAIFPTTLGIAGARHPSHSGTVFSLLIGLALTGGMTVPWLAGRIAQSHGLSAALLLAIIDAIAIFFLQFVAQRILRRSAHA